MASSCIPFVSDKGIGRRYRNKLVVDGGVINNHPFFRDGKRRQVALQLSKVNYAVWPSYTPVDPCVEALVMRGGLEARRFLAGYDDATSMEWKDRDFEHHDPNTIRHRLYSVIKWTILLFAAAPCLMLFVSLKSCSASFNALLMRGVGVSGAVSARVQLLLVALMAVVCMLLGWQAVATLVCVAAFLKLLEIHDDE